MHLNLETKTQTDAKSVMQCRQRRQMKIGLCIAAGLALLTANYLVWGYKRFASRELEQTKQIVASVERLADAEAKYQSKNDLLETLMHRSRTSQLQVALRDGFEAAKPDLFFFSRAPSQFSDANTTAYLYSPDDDQTLVMQIEVSDLASGTRQLNPATKGTVESKRLEFPLVAGKLHHFEFGESEGAFRVTFDHQDQYSTPFPGSSGSASVLASGQGDRGMLQPGLLTDRFQDFRKPVELGTWLNIQSMVFQRSRKNAKKSRSIGVRAFIQTKGKMSIPASLQNVASKDLNLKWNADTNSYQVVSVKPAH